MHIGKTQTVFTDIGKFPEKTHFYIVVKAEVLRRPANSAAAQINNPKIDKFR